MTTIEEKRKELEDEYSQCSNCSSNGILFLMCDYHSGYSKGFDDGVSLAQKEFEENEKYIGSSKLFKVGYKEGYEKAQKEFKIWLEELLITNWEVEQVKMKIEELKKAVSNGE